MFNIFSKKASDKTSSKQIKKYFTMVEAINSLESKYESYSDNELKNMTEHFQKQLNKGKTVDDIKFDAFAVVREASKRVLHMRHFDVQLIGGLVLAEGNIAEMATGEGKTLVASLPSYLRALEGKGVHVITVNDYLAKRDREVIGQIHEFLGLKVGLNLPMMEPDAKKAAYQADITYGVGTEFGFDYLRDNMVYRLQDKVQRPYHFAIIDEVDSVLIDEAKTPLIIAGKMKSDPELHYVAARLAKRFKQDEEYEFDDETKATSLTELGIEKVEKAFGVDNLYDLDHQLLYHYVIQAVRAHVIFKRDVDYIVQDGEIKLVDMFTGRIMEGRTLSEGLHQALEAKEGLEITDENKTQAQITIQNYYRMYPNLSGMTGTAKTEEREFRQIYNMEVIQIPTNRPKIRVDMPDRVYETTDGKYRAVLEEVKKRHATGQPILIGTTSILQSEKVAEYLDKEKLSYELLNAKSVEQEVELISMAGQKGQITIATNMAGRGTDILLGEGVNELGGLHVIGTEKHESRRVDNQLRGRSGRQGDPGSSQFFISLEDDMFRRFAKDDLAKLQSKLKVDEDGLVLNKKIDEFVERTQRIVEGANFAMREYNLKLDDVINEQRTIIYDLRNQIMADDSAIPHVQKMATQAFDHLLDAYCPEDQHPEEWKVDKLLSEVNRMSMETKSLPDEQDIMRDDIQQLLDECKQQFNDQLETTADKEDLQMILRNIMLGLIDSYWVRHIENMARLKEGVGLRHYQQEDPMRLYQKEGLQIFTDMFYRLQTDAASRAAQLMRDVQ
ncbi:MAG TPA: accessory Sec system translocase SecA2 [Chondromyces sp.]|nr:accessory Sec system translocase SecA2 [Chondromyces sp.]